MSRLKNGLKDTVLTQSAIFFLPDTLKATGSTISTPKSYDENPHQVKYGESPSPPPPPGLVESLSDDDGNVNENVAKQWIKLQNTITARGNATTWPLFRRRL